MVALFFGLGEYHIVIILPTEWANMGNGHALIYNAMEFIKHRALDLNCVCFHRGTRITRYGRIFGPIRAQMDTELYGKYMFRLR